MEGKQGEGDWLRPKCGVTRTRKSGGTSGSGLDICLVTSHISGGTSGFKEGSCTSTITIVSDYQPFAEPHA